MVGWYKDSGFAVEWDFANDTVTGNITLYARWSVAGPSRVWAEDGKAYAVANAIGYDDNAGGGTGAFCTSGWSTPYVNGPGNAALWTYQYTGNAASVVNETTVTLTSAGNNVVPWNDGFTLPHCGAAVDVRVPTGYDKVASVQLTRKNGTAGLWSAPVESGNGGGANINGSAKGSDVAKGGVFTTAGEGIIYLYPRIEKTSANGGPYNISKYTITWNDTKTGLPDLIETIIIDCSALTKLQTIVKDASLDGTAKVDAGYVRGLTVGSFYKVVLSGSTTGTDGTYYATADGTLTQNIGEIAALDATAEITPTSVTPRRVLRA